MVLRQRRRAAFVVLSFVLLMSLFDVLRVRGQDLEAPAYVKDITAFTAKAATLFAKAMPEAKVEIMGPLALSIALPNQGSRDAMLNNIYSFCLRNPNGCEKGLAHHVERMAASFEAPATTDPSKLRAIVRQAALVEVANQAYARNGGTTVSEKLIGDLWVMCALDRPGAVETLNTNELAKMNLSRGEALAACKQNVAAALPPLEPLRRNYLSPGVNLAADDAYQASWLIFPERWAAIAESVDGNLLFAAPAINAVVYMSGKEADAVATLAKVAAHVAMRAQKPLSASVRWTPTGWEEARP